MANYKGLTSAQVRTKQEQFGPNTIVVKKKKSLLKTFVAEFKDIMIIALILAAAIAIINGESIDGAIILAIVFINAIISFVQQFRAEKSLEALQNMVTPQAKVLRDGTWQLLPSPELVPGDIIKLEAGDRINADAVLLEANNLYTQESILTGESLPIHKEVQQTIFMGTEVTNGFAIAQISTTGLKTEFGKIATLTETADSGLSPLQREIKKIGLFVTKIALVIAVILFAIQLYTDPDATLIQRLLFVTSVTVAAVPEGLPATITIALALGVERMAKKKAIVKKLSSVETLGSTSCIITDKTGTLTKNEMTVRQITLLDNHAEVTGEGYNTDGKINFTQKISTKALLQLQKVNQYCVTASITTEANGTTDVLGDPTEAALIILGQKISKQFNITDTNSEINGLLPFDSKRKMMSVLVSDNTNNTTETITKGAPESILPLCTHVLMSDGSSKPITQELSNKIQDQLSKLNEQAYRTLAYAFNTQQELAEEKLTFVCLVSMIDPPRSEVKAVLKKAKNAGLKIFVATGDHPETAAAIGKQIGLITNNNQVISREQFSKLSPEELADILKGQNAIFARVNPQDKLTLVKAAQELNEIVAVTGDGVNDAPALKQADIGVAMGITGTDVSKEAADVVLTNDQFTTIIEAIREGRIIYQNLRKIVYYLLSSNIGELVCIFLAIILGFNAPLTAVLLLLINVGTDAMPAIGLSVDYNEFDPLKKPPRKKHEHMLSQRFVTHVLSTGMVVGLISFSNYLSVLYTNGWTTGTAIPPDIKVKAVTATFVSLVVTQFFNSFNASTLQRSILTWRPQKHLFQIGSGLFTLTLLYLVTTIPTLQNVFGTTNLSAQLWATIFGFGFSVVVINEIFKFIFYGQKE